MALRIEWGYFTERKGWIWPRSSIAGTKDHFVKKFKELSENI